MRSARVARSALVVAVFVGVVGGCRHFTGLPEVGRLTNGHGGCTAGVLDTPNGDLILTAAHCLDGDPTQYTFTPMQHDNQSPYGTWQVSAAYVDAGWISSQAAADDFAVLAVRRATDQGHPTPIESVVGGGYVLDDTPSGAKVEVVGYPNGKSRPIKCDHDFTRTGDGPPTFKCGGFADGTSGAPWIDATTQHVDGIIGGLDQGGCSSSVSYSPVFGSTMRSVLQDAENGGPGTTTFRKPPDSCS